MLVALRAFSLLLCTGKVPRISAFLAEKPRRGRSLSFTPFVKMLAEAAAGEDVLAREPAGVVGSKEDRNRSDVAGLTQATERGLSD